MPRLLRGLFAAAAILLAAALAGPFPALAEMTEADRERMQIFAACLDETGGDEGGCFVKLGRRAWYPADDGECEAIGRRVEVVIELDGLPKWRDMYMNERCARLGMPHGIKGAAAGRHVDPDNPFIACAIADSWSNICIYEYGRQGWYPFRDKVCPWNAQGLARQMRDGERQPWNMLFYNERCRRLHMPYFEARQ